MDAQALELPFDRGHVVGASAYGRLQDARIALPNGLGAELGQTLENALQLGDVAEEVAKALWTILDRREHLVDGLGRFESEQDKGEDASACADWVHFPGTRLRERRSRRSVWLWYECEVWTWM